MESANLFLDWNRARRPWSEIALVTRLVKCQRQSVRIGERQRRCATPRFHFTNLQVVLGEPIEPVIDASQRDGERNFHRQSGSRFCRSHFRPREKGDV